MICEMDKRNCDQNPASQTTQDIYLSPAGCTVHATHGAEAYDIQDPV
jgi:hypothetical protein